MGVFLLYRVLLHIPFLISDMRKTHTIFVNNIKEKLEVEPTEEGGNYNERTYELCRIFG